MSPANFSQQGGIWAIDVDQGFPGMLKEMLECPIG